MKRKTAKEILAESFLEIAKDRPIDKITVREITQNCGYSNATFYRQFRDKYDLIIWEYTERHLEIMRKMEPTHDGWIRTLLEGAHFFNAQKEYLANLLLHTNGYDSFIRNMTEIHYRSMQKCVLEILGKTTLEEEMDMYVRLFCQGTVCLTCDWILGRYSCSPEDLARVYEKSLPLPLQSLFQGA